MLTRYEEEILTTFLRERPQLDIYTQTHALARAVMGVTSTSDRVVLRSIGSELAQAINEMCAFLLAWKDPDASKLLVDVQESISHFHLYDSSMPTSFFSIDVMMNWAKSEHAHLILGELSTYHESLDFYLWGKYLPRLFIETSVNVEKYYFDNHLALREGAQSVPYAVSAAIQHLRFGLDFDEDEVFKSFSFDASRNTIAQHASWLHKNFERNGIGDKERVANFFSLYSERMIDAEMGEGKLSVAKNLEFMCNDRTLTLNKYSKRAILSQDMGLDL